MQTERIGFSCWGDDDAPLAFLLWGDENVTRFLSAGGRFAPKDISRRLSLEINNQKQHHVQYWPIFVLSSGSLLGCCGLRPFSAEEHAFELGFHLRPEFWGRGYAFEAASAVITYGFSSLKATKLFAGHHPQNAASRKLLRRLGFRYIGDHFYEPTGLNHPSYELCGCEL